jgi:hypothetical protein
MSAKPAAKRERSTKRKAADAIADADADNAASSLLQNLDLSHAKCGPRAIADALLSLLPDGATRQHSAAKKLCKAFPLVLRELDHRANILSRANEAEGTKTPISFSFKDEVIAVPEDNFVGILKFLDGREIVTTSLVCKAWLSVSRLPSLWERLDSTSGLTNKSRKLNMTSFLKVMARPQFSNLKHLEMSHHAMQLSKGSLSKLSKLLPHLEKYSHNGVWGTGHKLKDETLLQLVQSFPKLTSLRNVEMWHVTNNGIIEMAAISPNLLDLKINGSLLYLADSTLLQIAESCKNLQHFAYSTCRWGYNLLRDMLSGVGVIGLVRGCRRLETLELADAKRVDRESFQTIIDLVEDGDEEGEFSLHKIDLRGYPFVIKSEPLRIEEKFQSHG